MRTWVLVLGVGLGGCDVETPVATEAEGCKLDADCAEPLVCAFQKCHAECDPTQGSRDCKDGGRCVQDEHGTGICLLEEEAGCTQTSQCPPPLVCGVDDQCRAECVSNSDCPENSVCASGSCAFEEEVDDTGELPGDPEEGAPCRYNSECPEAFVCRSGACIAECVTSTDCPDGLACEAGLCLRLAACGDGVVDPDEACDDGNVANFDSCSNQCSMAICGDGIVQPPMGEYCDDGNAIDDDGCTNACTFPRCGDGILHSGEQCDDGNAIDDDACPNDCDFDFEIPFCETRVAHHALCGFEPLTLEECLQDPLAECADALLNPDLADAFLTCETSTCDDQCDEAVGVPSEVSAFQTACLQTAESCGGEVWLCDLFWGRTELYAAWSACLSEPCGEINVCFAATLPVSCLQD